jgi:Tfp pilus assembly protein PilN
MNDKTLDPARIISILEILLAQLEASLSPQMTEGDTRTDLLKKQISGFKDKTARLKTVLRKHQDAERRKRTLIKQNRQNRSRQ